MTSTENYSFRSGCEDEELNHLPVRFPNDTERRKVRVYIHSYKGLAYGAIHWYADVEEEDNSYIDHEDKSFRQPWGVWEHEHLRGQKIVRSFLTKTAAEEFVCATLEAFFSPETHWVFVDHDDQGKIYEELGYHVDTMYHDETRTVAEMTRVRLAAQYKTTEGRGG